MSLIVGSTKQAPGIEKILSTCLDSWMEMESELMLSTFKSSTTYAEFLICQQ